VHDHIGETVMATIRMGEQSYREGSGVEGSDDVRTMGRQAGTVVVAQGGVIVIERGALAVAVAAVG
jgi:hypothetical protein